VVKGCCKFFTYVLFHVIPICVERYGHKFCSRNSLSDNQWSILSIWILSNEWPLPFSALEKAYNLHGSSFKPTCVWFMGLIKRCSVNRDKEISFKNCLQQHIQDLISCIFKMKSVSKYVNFGIRRRVVWNVFSALKTEAGYLFETSVIIYKALRFYIPKLAVLTVRVVVTVKQLCCRLCRSVSACSRNSPVLTV
jgi:hypothetical protein